MLFFKKKLLFLLTVLVSCTWSLGCVWFVDSRDIGGDLLADKGPRIYRVTPVDNRYTGGTGFALTAPSGQTITITNAHVCEIGKASGQMAAWMDGSDRPYILRIQEISETTDLCVLTGAPNTPGMALASVTPRVTRMYAVGHPHLRPNTLSTGYIVERLIIQVQDDADHDHCTGLKRSWEQEMTLFGPVGVCVANIDSYDTSIVSYPGNSGSPVFDYKGAVVGVIFASTSSTHYAAIIPLDVLREFVSRY